MCRLPEPALISGAEGRHGLQNAIEPQRIGVEQRAAAMSGKPVAIAADDIDVRRALGNASNAARVARFRLSPAAVRHE
jgi:hypothetical protein